MTTPSQTKSTDPIRQCGYCYAKGNEFKACGGCDRRFFCCREHQKLDWKNGHSKWCCKSGEIDFDYEVREAKDKIGLGMFALRDFKRGEKILVERPIMKISNPVPRDPRIRFNDDDPPSVRAAIHALYPEVGDLKEKFVSNCVSLVEVKEKVKETRSRGQEDCQRLTAVGNGSTKQKLNEWREAGMFVNFSRANHCCVGNCEHDFLSEHNLIFIVASCDVKAKEEILFRYVIAAESPEERKSRLNTGWGFVCDCRACNNADVEAQIELVKELDGCLYHHLGSKVLLLKSHFLSDKTEFHFRIK